MTTAQPDPHKAIVPCTDGFRRQRSVGIWTAPTSGMVVLLAPPAETALLNPDQARQLGRHLIDLAAATEHQHITLAHTHRDRSRSGGTGRATQPLDLDTTSSGQWHWRDESQLLAAISATNPRLGFYALRLLDVDADRADEWPVAEEQQLGRDVAEIGQSILRRARIRAATEQPSPPAVIDQQDDQGAAPGDEQ